MKQNIGDCSLTINWQTFLHCLHELCHLVRLCVCMR